MNSEIPTSPSLPTTAISADAPSSITWSSETAESTLRALHGKTNGEPGLIETPNETANRQQLVDSLSASAGVTAPTVEARQMPDVQSLADSSEPLERLRALTWLLFNDAA